MTPNNQPATYKARRPKGESALYLFAVTQNHLDGIKADNDLIEFI